MLAVLLVLGGFAPLIYADLTLSLLTADDGVITGHFADSLLLSLPSCEYAGQSMDVEYLNINMDKNKTLHDAFAVPSCDHGTGTDASPINRRIGYQLMGLASNTEYMIRYKIGSTYSDPIMATTRQVRDYNSISTERPASSAAMVVITVILSVSMFILLLSVSASPMLSRDSD